MAGWRIVLPTSVLGPPRPPSIISQERSGHSPGNVLWGPPKLQLITVSSTSQEPHWPVFFRTFGWSQSWQRCWAKCHPSSSIAEPFARRARAARKNETLQETKTRFLLFEGATDRGCQIQLHRADTLQQCGFNASLPLVMIIHGWSVRNADTSFLLSALTFSFFSSLPRVLSSNKKIGSW